MIGTTPASRLRVSVLFTVSEAAMLLIGLALGAPLGRAIGDTADYVAIAILLSFGLYTLLATDQDEQQLSQLAEARGPRALLLGLSISVDELAVGFTLGLLRLPAALAGLRSSRSEHSPSPNSASGLGTASANGYGKAPSASLAPRSPPSRLSCSQKNCSPDRWSAPMSRTTSRRRAARTTPWAGRTAAPPGLRLGRLVLVGAPVGGVDGRGRAGGGGDPIQHAVALPAAAIAAGGRLVAIALGW